MGKSVRSTRGMEVAVGVVKQGKKVLVSQREKDSEFGGQWEFPGGKLEPGETALTALRRELKEEVGIDVIRAQPLIDFMHNYGSQEIYLRVFEVRQYSGEPRGAENQQIAWYEPQRLKEVNFLKANDTVLNAIALPRRCLITDTSRFGVGGTLEHLDLLIKQQNFLIVLREKKMDPTGFRDFVNAVMEIASPSGSLVVNHVENNAIVDSVAGVHYPSAVFANGRSPLSAGKACRGVSCHTYRDLVNAEAMGFDYAFLSPVKITASHPNAEPLGWTEFKTLCRGVRIPVYALGGMGFDDFDTAIHSGAQGLAMINAAWSARDIDTLRGVIDE